ncbi:hypothetical protein Plhal710r2_c014g0065231 [Plasmopara halstedii]
MNFSKHKMIPRPVLMKMILGSIMPRIVMFFQTKAYHLAYAAAIPH